MNNEEYQDLMYELKKIEAMAINTLERVKEIFERIDELDTLNTKVDDINTEEFSRMFKNWQDLKTGKDSNKINVSLDI